MRFVQADKLEPGMVLGRDIIASRRKGMMLSKGMVLNESYIAHIRQHGYLGVYITDSISEDIEIEEVIDQALFAEGIEAVFQADVGAMANVATRMVQQISDRDSVRVDLFDLRSYDDYTYHHSVNVAVYATVIGRKMGLSYADQELLAMAAISHDLGKSKISEMILNKPGKLDDSEYELIKKHSQFSYDMLSADSSIPSKVKLGVLFHHENEDGSGYPKGITGESIPLFSKIIHAVDVFDALTSKRPYKQPYSPAETFKYMQESRGILFDDAVVNCMMSSIPAFPPGLDVSLSNGKEALVVENSIHAMKPIIKLYDSDEKINMYTHPDYKDIKIVSSGIMQADYAQKVEKLNETRQKAKARKPRVLIVDSNRNALVQAQNVLADEYIIETMSSGIEAINYFADNHIPDLLIVDTDLPMVSGISTVKTIRESGVLIPVIFTAGKIDRDTLLRCKELGAVDCVLKPYNNHYLIERVQIALQR